MSTWRHTILRALPADAIGAELSALYWHLLAKQGNLHADDDNLMLIETDVVICRRGYGATGVTDRVIWWGTHFMPQATYIAPPQLTDAQAEIFTQLRHDGMSRTMATETAVALVPEAVTA